MSDEKSMSISERLFACTYAEAELTDLLEEAGAQFDTLSWDHYDNSLELHGVPETYRLSPEVQRVIHSAGFATAFVNHVDKWETHYHFDPRKEFKESKGWRVSYGHERKDGTNITWVEEWPAGWDEKMRQNGSVIVKEPKS